MTTETRSSSDKKLSLTHKICSHEVNHQQKLSIPTLMGMLQEVAYRHAEERGWGWSNFHPKNQYWVLMRLQIVFDQHPSWNDDILIHTWASDINRLFAKRSWQISHPEGESLFRCNSDWVIIDGTSRRVQRLDPMEFGSWCQQEAILENEPTKLDALESPVLLRQFDIRLSEIDFMQHVNNANYVKWVLDSIDLDYLQTYEIAKLEVNFLKEAKYPSRLSILKQTLTKTSSLFCIVSNTDNTEHVRVLIEWREKQE